MPRGELKFSMPLCESAAAHRQRRLRIHNLHNLIYDNICVSPTVQAGYASNFSISQMTNNMNRHAWPICLDYYGYILGSLDILTHTEYLAYHEY